MIQRTDLYRCMWQREKFLFTLSPYHPKSWQPTRDIVTRQPRTPICHSFGSAVEANARSPKEMKRFRSQECSRTNSIDSLVQKHLFRRDLRWKLAHLTSRFMILACKIAPHVSHTNHELIQLTASATFQSTSHRTCDS